MKPQMTVIILRTQHPDYEPPQCDPQCIKDAVLVHLDKVSIDVLILLQYMCTFHRDGRVFVQRIELTFRFFLIV